jgi:hypothetical protein
VELKLSENEGLIVYLPFRSGSVLSVLFRNPSSKCLLLCIDKRNLIASNECEGWMGKTKGRGAKSVNRPSIDQVSLLRHDLLVFQTRQVL